MTSEISVAIPGAVGHVAASDCQGRGAGSACPVRENGEDVIEGPHYPESHRWYARVLVQNGRIVKVLS